ncbi:hypothetical protein RF11_09010 [Thelohanellus kitauei]|uniref:Uncharacterized protein n=1 Tax=Thelohanellus kitauei TaxID=669202 RepID=A0A0C2IV04_THEKT|nr:hypothetical protein RF11_09010 [Thelohanellus kitauei]
MSYILDFISANGQRSTIVYPESRQEGSRDHRYVDLDNPEFILNVCLCVSETWRHPSSPTEQDLLFLANQRIRSECKAAMEILAAAERMRIKCDGGFILDCIIINNYEFIE